jgi:hypothetical protein
MAVARVELSDEEHICIGFPSVKSTITPFIYRLEDNTGKIPVSLERSVCFPHLENSLICCLICYRKEYFVRYIK